MSTDTRQIVDSYALAHRFAALGTTVKDNALLPRKYKRVQTPFMKQNRRQNFACAYGDSNKSYEFQESLQIVASAFLKITLPQHATDTYKRIPGLHIIKNFTLRCNGDLVYSVDCQTLFSEHLQSLSDEDAREYCAAYLGDVGSASNAARDLYLPIPLPNSSVWFRGGRGNGIMPWQSFRNNRIEVSFDFYGNTQASSDVTAACPAFTNPEILIKECVVPLRQVNQYKSARANFSVVGRRFTKVQDWAVADANTEQSVVVSNLSGCVTMLVVEAVAHQADIASCNIRAPITPSKVKLIADSVQVIDQPDKSEIRLIEYQHGFKRNEFFSGQTYRLCFGSHGYEDDDTFVGAMNFSHLSQVDLKIQWDQKVYYKIHAVQLCKNDITSAGSLRQTLEA